MMMRHWLIAAALPFMFMLVTANLRADEEVTIMAVGDSITQGGNSFRCYREYLVPMLSKGETKVRFVGPHQDHFSAHCGYGGKKSAVRMNAKGIHVILVNLAKDFDWKSDTVDDKVHPNESGARKMAERWMSALKPVLDQRQKDQNRETHNRPS